MWAHRLSGVRDCAPWVVKSEAEGCVTAKSLQPSFEQAVDEMVASAADDDVGERRLGRGRTKMIVDGFYHRRVFREDGVVGCPVLEKPEPNVREMERWETVSDRVRSYDAA